MCVKCGCGKKKGERGFGMGPMGSMKKTAKKVVKKAKKK